jgi:hypothetical protein
VSAVEGVAGADITEYRRAIAEAETLLESVGASEDRGNLWNTVTSKKGAEMAEVVNQDKLHYDNTSFFVGVRFMSNDVF